MKLGILVRDVHFHRPFHTTMQLAHAALRRGHTVLLFGVGELTFDERGGLWAEGVRLRRGMSLEVLCHRLLEDALPVQRTDLRSLDLLLVRFNPMAREPFALEWQHWWPALLVLQRLADEGLEVVNDPHGLTLLLTKLHTGDLPASAAIPGLVTRSAAEVDSFQQRLGGERLIAKPLAGSQGNRVFLLEPGERANRDQILEGLFESGYALVQPFLEQAWEGDKRALLIDGEPLEVDGRVAVYRRKGPEGRVRNNIHAGGERSSAGLDDVERARLAALTPWLRKHGLRLVGVDLLGGRVLEVNAFCPGGIENINRVHGLDLAPCIIDRLVRPRPRPSSTEEKDSP